MDDFESHRAFLTSLAYRLLGSATEAEDMVQEAYLRVAASPTAPGSMRAWLATITTRLCLDHLKSARIRREEYVGPWLPEPIATDNAPDPEALSLAFMVLLESLTPVERAVYVLSEAFDFTHAEIAPCVDKDEAACRQILRRARQHVAAHRPRFAPTKEAHLGLLLRFGMACQSGDLEGLKALLASDAMAWTDGGGKVSAALRPVSSADHIARFLLGVLRKGPPELMPVVEEINGSAAIVARLHGAVISVLEMESDGERIHGLRIVSNPEKLGQLARRDATGPV